MDGNRSRADFSGVSQDEALARARALVPFLREQAPKCEALRRLTPEVMDALHKNGLLRYMQPKVWGGMELPFVAHYDIPEALARGDISTAWVVVNLAGHHRSLTWWEPQAQREVWGENPDAGIASGIAYSQGRGVPVEGGLLLSGEWNFSSGQDHSDWSQLACIVREGDKPVDYAIIEGGTLDIETRLRYKRNTAMAAKLVCEAVDSLHEMAGANGVYDRYPLQRMFRDSHAAAGHFSFSMDAQLPPWGLVMLGGPFTSPTL